MKGEVFFKQKSLVRITTISCWLQKTYIYVQIYTLIFYTYSKQILRDKVLREIVSSRFITVLKDIFSLEIKTVLFYIQLKINYSFIFFQLYSYSIIFTVCCLISSYYNKILWTINHQPSINISKKREKLFSKAKPTILKKKPRKIPTETKCHRLKSQVKFSRC